MFWRFTAAVGRHDLGAESGFSRPEVGSNGRVRAKSDAGRFGRSIPATMYGKAELRFHLKQQYCIYRRISQAIKQRSRRQS
jgi:hypothetical protein